MSPSSTLTFLALEHLLLGDDFVFGEEDLVSLGVIKIIPGNHRAQ